MKYYYEYDSFSGLSERASTSPVMEESFDHLFLYDYSFPCPTAPKPIGLYDEEGNKHTLLYAVRLVLSAKNRNTLVTSMTTRQNALLKRFMHAAECSDDEALSLFAEIEHRKDEPGYLAY